MAQTCVKGINSCDLFTQELLGQDQSDSQTKIVSQF